MKQQDQIKVTAGGKILLLVLPYWTPLIPPQGISIIKHFLQDHGYRLTAKDANIEAEFTEIYDRYFEVLGKYVPPGKQGNFFNVGYEVIRNHMSAHIHYTDENAYISLVKIIIYNTYFTGFTTARVKELNDVLDLFFKRLEDYMISLVEKEKPDVLGISVFGDTVAPSMFAFRAIRARYPQIMTVMGGLIFADQLFTGSPNLEYFLEKTPYIDKIVIGAGQEILLKILQGEFPREKRVFTLNDIQGKTSDFISMELPDYSDFKVGEDYPYMTAQASKSCPYRCSFCNVESFYGEYQQKSAQQTAAEMTKLYDLYGNQLFFMLDSLLNPIAPGLSQELLKSPVPLYWDGYLRVAPPVTKPEKTIQWRRGGMYRVRLGIESGSQAVLDAMDKKITPQLAKDSLFSLANAGIKTTTYWVIGHPGETEADFLETLKFLEENRNYIYEAECNPFIYGYTGQSGSDCWQDKRVFLYPPEAKDMLIIQSWRVNDEPTREETYRRINRFVQHCKFLGIPNPYSMKEIYQADVRWQKLHKNAVPSLVEFEETKSKGTYIDECKQVKQITLLKPGLRDDGLFGF
jgi:hypothetical protein